jgi:hypothetical protein
LPDALDGIAFVAQDTPLYKNLSAADMMHLTRNLNRRFRPGIRARPAGRARHPAEAEGGQAVRRPAGAARADPGAGQAAVQKSGTNAALLQHFCPSAPPSETLGQCLSQHGYTQWTSYQPASRFWPFQWIEGGWLLVLSVLLIAVTVWPVRRRAA